MSYRIAFKQFVPPIALEGYRAVKRAVQTQPLVEWSWLSSWPDTQMPSGWNHQSIVDAQIRKWPQFCAVLEGSGPLGVAHEAEEHVDGASEDVAWRQRGHHRARESMSTGLRLVMGSRGPDCILPTFSCSRGR